MAKIRLKVDVVSTINDLTSDRQKRIAYKEIMSSPEAKREYGRRLVDQIIDRTLSGKDKDGDRFKGYSQAYKKSLQFKIYDKTSTVNLKLTGAMQAAIAVVGVDTRSVILGFIDSQEEAKAEGHIKGANNLPVRDFWGLTKDEKEEILKDTISFVANGDITLLADELNRFEFSPTSGDQTISGEILFDEDV